MELGVIQRLTRVVLWRRRAQKLLPPPTCNQRYKGENARDERSGRQTKTEAKQHLEMEMEDALRCRCRPALLALELVPLEEG
jgi:hypothetical protein